MSEFSFQASSFFNDFRDSTCIVIPNAVDKTTV